MGNTRMRPRLVSVCAGLAACWSVGYLGLCLQVLQGEDRIAWWFIGLIGIASILCLVGLVSFRPRPVLLAAAVLLMCCSLVGVLSIGLGFVPAAALALIAGLAARNPTPGD